MARPSQPKFPSIAVDDGTTKRTLNVPNEMEAELAQYAEYFHDATGKKPRSTEDVMLGVISAYLGGDAAFKKWKSSKPAASRAKASAPAAS